MPKLKFATDASGNKFYPISIVRGIVDTDRNQRLNVTIAELYDALIYQDVYIGAGATSASVISNDYHHDTIVRGRPISVTISTDNTPFWVVLPAAYTPILTMERFHVPVTVDSTTTISGKSYKIWKSSSTFVSGSYELSLF